MKGLLKGLRYFSHMFEEEKEPEIQIGAPTDVKHVAHIGWDGPSSVETPSWMKEFKSSGGVETASVGAAPKNSFRADEGKSTRELPDIPKSSSRQIISQENTYSQSPSRETSTAKSRQSKRTQYKDSPSDGSKSIMEPDQSPSRNPTDVVAATKKSRRKKSKESINVGPSKSTRSKPRERDSSSSSSTNTNTMQPYPDPGQPMSGSNKGSNDIYQNSSSSSKPIYTRGNEDKW